MTLRGYQPYIQAACGCPDKDAAAVEGIMRDRNGGVLDSLYPDEFKREARMAREILEVLHREEPGLVAYYEQKGC